MHFLANNNIQYDGHTDIKIEMKWSRIIKSWYEILIISGLLISVERVKKELNIRIHIVFLRFIDFMHLNLNLCGFFKCHIHVHVLNLAGASVVRDWTSSAGLSCDLTFKEAAQRIF